MPQTTIERDNQNKFWSEQEFFSAKPFEFVHAYLHKNYTQKMHSHQFYEINIITSGSGKHYIEEASMTTSVGDVFIIPPKTLHTYYSEDTIDVFHILIGSEFFRKYKDELEQSRGVKILFDAEPHLRLYSGKNSNLHLDLNDFNDVKHDLELILFAQDKNEFAMRAAITLSFVLKLSSVLIDTIKNGSTHSNSAEMLSIMNYINDNLENKLSLKEIADFAGVSIATLNRRFLTSIGIPPLKYTTECRVKKAKELINQDIYTRTEIAQICGFFDVSHMNKYIK